MGISFIDAIREKIWVKVLLAGPSGSGKTYSALRIATGMAKKCHSNIAAMDTENGRLLYYADLFDFKYIKMEEPYSPEKYIEVIDAAVDKGFKILIIDSISHEWKYINDTHDKMQGNSFTNWGKLKPRHNNLMEKILQAPIHIIVTARGKDEYVLEEKNGKQVPKKVGLGITGDKEIEYNYSVAFNLVQDTHIANATKDNTRCFDGRYDVLTEKDGEALYDWANSGAEPVAKKESTPPVGQKTVEEVQKEIIEIAKPLMKTHRDKVMEILSKAPDGNPNKITDIKIALQIESELCNVKEDK